MRELPACDMAGGNWPQIPRFKAYCQLSFHLIKDEMHVFLKPAVSVLRHSQTTSSCDHQRLRRREIGKIEYYMPLIAFRSSAQMITELNFCLNSVLIFLDHMADREYLGR